MKNFYTDLALEEKENPSAFLEGVVDYKTEREGFLINTVKITSAEAEKNLNKEIGTYVTVHLEDLENTDEFEKISDIVGDEIKKLLPENIKKILVVGLGNKNMTPDALGPLATESLMATRHLKEILPKYFTDETLKEVSVLAPGVLFQTGIESAEIIDGTIIKTDPDLVIVIDALASKSKEHLASTIQMSNTGLTPGGGVGNKRKEISKRTLNKEVLSIGVPTVVDNASLTLNFLENLGVDSDEIKKASNLLENSQNKFFVTPKEIDSLVKKLAKIIGFSINKALHKGIRVDEMTSFVS